MLALCTHVLGRHCCGDGVRPTSLLEPAVGCHLSFFTVDLAATYAQALLHGAVGLSAPASRPWAATRLVCAISMGWWWCCSKLRSRARPCQLSE